MTARKRTGGGSLGETSGLCGAISDAIERGYVGIGGEQRRAGLDNNRNDSRRVA